MKRATRSTEMYAIICQMYAIFWKNLLAVWIIANLSNSTQRWPTAVAKVCSLLMLRFFCIGHPYNSEIAYSALWKAVICNKIVCLAHQNDRLRSLIKTLPKIQRESTTYGMKLHFSLLLFFDDIFHKRSS